MNSTLAIVIIGDADKAQAQADLSDGLFTTPLSASGEAPATHWMSSGWFFNDQLNKICNDVTWAKTIRFGDDWQSVLHGLNLMIVQDSE